MYHALGRRGRQDAVHGSLVNDKWWNLIRQTALSASQMHDGPAVFLMESYWQFRRKARNWNSLHARPRDCEEMHQQGACVKRSSLRNFMSRMRSAVQLGRSSEQVNACIPGMCLIFSTSSRWRHQVLMLATSLLKSSNNSGMRLNAE